MEGKEIILKKHLTELFGREMEPNDGVIINVKTAKKAMDDYTSQLQLELEKAKELLNKYVDHNRVSRGFKVNLIDRNTFIETITFLEGSGNKTK